MSHMIGLYHGSTRCGEVELDSLFVMGPADYLCEPKDVVSEDEVVRIAKMLRREPEIHAGVVGELEWREEPHQPQGSQTHHVACLAWPGNRCG